MKSVVPIHLSERDVFLFREKCLVWPPTELDMLMKPASGKAVPGRWEAGKWERAELEGQPGAFLWRTLKKAEASKEGGPSKGGEASLCESVLSFPSAPLFGIQAKPGYQVDIKPIHQHTLRLLTASRKGDDKPPIKRIYLLFNGLNEIDFFDLYYDLASQLIGNGLDEGLETSEVACIIHPFPGHLTRYPLIGRYAEKPLQRFIMDPSDLFRQYLRFMVEMQWLISVLVPVSYYPVAPGISLLSESTEPRGGRCDAETLAQAIHEEWKALYGQHEPRGEEVDEGEIMRSIMVIRDLIGWEPCEKRLVDFGDEPLPYPQLHVIGYSLGGYLAQCVFFTWPFAIGSCTTLCSGGALSELTPERIIHAEEWRAITHALKYELESGMLEGRIRADTQDQPRSVCGIKTSYFSSHFQVFNDIFLQDPHGSHRHRVSEFSPRMFFVVGGNDPIVSARSILQSSPSGGINMIEIAKLSHFIATDTGEWPVFWQPTIVGIISSLATHSEQLLRKSVLSNLWNETTSDGALQTWLSDETKAEEATFGRSPEREKAERRVTEPLNASRMQETLSDLLSPLRKDDDGKEGFLFILRNQIPVTLLGMRMLGRRGSVPHYEDFEIREFWQKLQDRRLIMRKYADRITLVIPGRLGDWFTQVPTILSVKHLPVARELPLVDVLRDIWSGFLADWENEKGALYRFDPQNPKDINSSSNNLFSLERMVRKNTGTPEYHPVLNCLPDVWVSLSQDVVTEIAGSWASRETLHGGFIHRMLLVYEHGRKSDQSREIGEWLETRKLRVMRVSPAQPSPYFLGERIWDPDLAIDLLTHSALALARSTPCKAPGDFRKGWPPSSS